MKIRIYAAPAVKGLTMLKLVPKYYVHDKILWYNTIM